MRERHGESYASERTPEYAAWTNMIQRCENTKLRHYSRYGGRGISVCERWRRSFTDFLADMGRRPSAQHSLDRYPNASGNYEPGNVRWATEHDQQRNRSTNRSITVEGVTKCLSEWAEETGIRRETIAMRLNAGMSPAKALSLPVGPEKYPFQGEMLSVRQLALRLGIPGNSLLRRLQRHGDLTQAIEQWNRNTRGKKPREPSSG